MKRDYYKHMNNLKNKSYEELLEIRRNSIPGADIYQQADAEINRIQQDTNNTQIAKLIDEIKILKDVTKDNADLSKRNSKNSDYLAKVAIGLAIVQSFLSIVSIKYTIEQTNLTELQSRGERIQQLRSINNSVELCKTDRALKDSGLFDVSTGKPATCEEVLKQYAPESILDKLKNTFNSSNTNK